jgi:hypothetical protein
MIWDLQKRSPNSIEVERKKHIGFLLQQPLGIRMHAGELLCDRMLRAVLLLRQPLDPPDLEKKLADLLRYILAILFSHRRWGLVAPECRQREEGQRFWYNAYWKTELAK